MPEHDWAISANHAVWPAADVEQRERRAPSPRYPDDYVRLDAGYIKPANLAWYASHQHTAAGLNQPYSYSYLFAYALDIQGDERSLTLPDNSKVRILAVSMADENPGLTPAQPLYDMLSRTGPAQTPSH